MTSLPARVLGCLAVTLTAACGHPPDAAHPAPAGDDTPACPAGVAADGTCVAAEPVACGARAGDTCAADQFCSFTLAATCGWADAQGTCAPRPEMCTEQYQPVCGCDHKTYGNACAANAAGTSVVSDGACAPA